ncbi:hypothetical protein HHK36_030167 [Tetracentron sinense]|uniref:Myb/SANT-like domain-containing protein n=1 Tax=Tetracentron sinense TaxID=13715 RepID=A0A834YAR8_TETSI|nr:hypothetical protein HHK36_030167 [Tetracentron sinense]
MFLHILSHNLKNSTIKFFYRRSGVTVSRQFQNVLRSVLRLHKDFLKLHEVILDEHDINEWKWFKNSLGALDGTYVNLTEGTASNSRVLRDALRRCNCLQVPSVDGWNILYPYLKENKTVKVKKNMSLGMPLWTMFWLKFYLQMAIGNKADPGWKPPAYRAAVNTLNARFNISINKQNVKNRLKSWGKHYTIVSEIIKQSGFSWDTHKKMITVDDENVWNAYVKSNPNAGPYRYKAIENWDDLVLLFGKDKANGEGAKNAADADEVMIDEETGDVEPTSLGLDDIGANEAINTPTTRARA